MGINFRKALKKLMLWDGVNIVDIIATNGFFGLCVVAPSRVDDGNSSSTPLSADATFTGEWENVLNDSDVKLTVRASHTSAVDGLCIEFSTDGVNVDSQDTYTIPPDTGKTISLACVSKYLRVVYTNGDTDQTFFRLQTIIKPNQSKSSSHRTKDNISGEDDAELVKATISGQDVVTGDFINVGTKAGDVGNNLLVSVDQVETTTNSLQTITYSHAELHSGKHYHVNQYESISKNGVKDILIVTPNTTRWAHMVLEASTSASPVSAALYEGVTTSDDGTIDGARNRNRNFPDDNTTLVYNDPTVTDVGTLLHDVYIGSGRGVGGGARDAEETLLKQNTKYLFRFTEQSVTSTVVSWIFDWYEHTNK